MHLLKTIAIVSAAVLLTTGCTSQNKPKFADVAELLCEGLDDLPAIRDGVINIHALMKQHDYAGALAVAYELASSLDKSGTVSGSKELQALVFLLESIVKKPMPDAAGPV